MKLVFRCCLACLFFHLTVKAQKIYITTGSEVIKMNVTPAGCVSSKTIYCSNSAFYSIAIFKDNFYFTKGGYLNRAILRNDVISNCTPLVPLPPASSLTVDTTGMIYAVDGHDLYKIDPSSATVTHLGALPFLSAGDLIFYKGVLYMASPEGIVKVNVSLPSQSVLYIPMSLQSIFGLAALSVDCHQIKIYAFSVGISLTDIIEIDLDNQSVTGLICQVPIVIGDAASDVESGQFAGININEIVIIPQCNVPGKSALQIVREPGLAPYIYTLNNGITNSTGLFENLDPGNYQVTITTAGGCLKDTVITVPLFHTSPLRIQVHYEHPDCSGNGTIWFDAGPDAAQYRVVYNNDIFSPYHIFSGLREGLHHFKWLNAYNCVVDSSNVNLILQGLCDTIFFPTAFTPGKDGLNDVFRGSSNASIEKFELKVFNRWGQVVFMSDDMYKGWDGFYQSKRQPAGNYIWFAAYITRTGKKKIQKGMLMLIR